MIEVIIISVVLIILIFLTVFFISVYNKLVLLRNDLNNNWIEIRALITKRYELATKLISGNEDNEYTQKLLNLINRHSTAVSVDDVIYCFIELEKVIPNFKMNQELMNAFNINRESLLKIRETYNNNVLKFNGIIKSFPVNILAIATGFTKWIYFRSEE